MSAYLLGFLAALLFTTGLMAQEQTRSLSRYSQSTHSVPVLSIEYPPFTTATRDDFGVAHRLLNEYAQAHFQVAVSPWILPPARAQQKILDGDWCLSFYPPVEGDKHTDFIPLGNDFVKLGLFRIKQDRAFRWQSLAEYAGKSVAVLRSSSAGAHGTGAISDSGMKLVYVETVEQGINMLLKQRVDFAFSDNISLKYMHLTEHQRSQVQFSDTAIFEIPMGVYLNVRCSDRVYGKVD